MKMYDIVWGNISVTDPDVIKIINHSSMKRLKNIWISAYGYLFNLPRNSTRFEHCVGVYLLLRHFKASKKEQIAGLIHDISSTAFSHMSTYALQGKYPGSGLEFHELKQDYFIKKSGLARLLSKLGYNSSDLLHTDAFTLLENELPDICADRIDYALRDGLHLQIISRGQADKIIEGLIIHNGEFIFNDIESAYLYSFNFYILNKIFYGSAAEAHFNNDFGALVKYAMDKGVLSEEDWFSNDVSVMERLRCSKNTKVKSWLNNYNNKLIVYEDEVSPTKVFPKKFRIIDPKILIKGKLKRLSEVDSTYKKIIDDYKKIHNDHKIGVKIAYKD